MIIIRRRNDHSDHAYPFCDPQIRSEKHHQSYYERPSLAYSRHPVRHFYGRDADGMSHPMLYSSSRYHPTHLPFYPSFYQTSPMDQFEAVTASMVPPFAVPQYRPQPQPPRYYQPQPESLMPVMLLFGHKEGGKRTDAATSEIKKGGAVSASGLEAPATEAPALVPNSEAKGHGGKPIERESSSAATGPVHGERNGAVVVTDVSTTASATAASKKEVEQGAQKPEANKARPGAAAIVSRQEDAPAAKGQIVSGENPNAPLKTGNSELETKVKHDEDYADPLEILFRLFHKPVNTRAAVPKQAQDDEQKREICAKKAHDQSNLARTRTDATFGATTGDNANADMHVDRANDAVTINVDVTGYSASDLSVDYDGISRALTVSGERTNKLGYRTSFERRVPLDNCRFDVDGVSARLSDGVLSVRVPCRHGASSRRSIPIASSGDGKSSTAVDSGPSTAVSYASQSEKRVDKVVTDALPTLTPPGKLAEKTSVKDESHSDGEQGSKGRAEPTTMVAKQSNDAGVDGRNESKVKNGSDDAPAETVHADHGDTASVASSVSNASRSHKGSVSVRTVSSDDEDDEGEETFEVV